MIASLVIARNMHQVMSAIFKVMRYKLISICISESFNINISHHVLLQNSLSENTNLKVDFVLKKLV